MRRSGFRNLESLEGRQLFGMLRPGDARQVGRRRQALQRRFGFGIAGLILIAWFASELTEAVLWMVYPDTTNRFFVIDIFMMTSSVLLVFGGILVYFGYIYPAMRSRHKG